MSRPSPDNPPWRLALPRGIEERKLGLLVLVALSAAALAFAPPAAAQSPVAAFEPGPCPFQAYTIPAGERIDCGFLVVPENRAAPGSRMIRLAVAIIRTHNPTPAPDPILFLADGPGQSGLDAVSYFVDNAPGLRTARDIILLDQRGAGQSQPSLRCSEFDALEQATRARQLSLAEAVALDVQTAIACHDRLAASGVQLSAYTTAAAAADVNDLRLALGYVEWNLYGAGYGTRLALTLMRDHAGSVRSAVLDSALPPQVGVWEGVAGNANRAFGALFAGCAAQPACGSTYPDLAASFSAVVDGFNKAPLKVQTPDPVTGLPGPELVTGQRLVSDLYAALKASSQIRFLPLALAQLSSRNVGFAENFATAYPAASDSTHSALWYAVQCHDELPFNDLAKIRADANSYPRFRDIAQRDSTLAVCPAWGGGQAGPDDKSPIHSDIPTLVLAGEYDPVQPPAWGQLVASTLRHSYYFSMPGAGHIVSFQGCGQALTAQFIQDPSVGPATGCVTGLGSPPFVTAAYLNPGVYGFARRLLAHFDLRQSLPILVCGALFASALLGWPVAAVLNRRQPSPRLAKLARWLAALTALLEIAFAAVLVWQIGQVNVQQPGLSVFGLLPDAAPLFVLPWLAAAFSLGLLGLAVVAWKERYWSIVSRVHYTLVALAAAGFVWLLHNWGLIGSR